MKNPVKNKIREGQAAFGVCLSLNSAAAVEVFGYLGYDFVFIDAEQTPVGLKECTELVRACNLTGLSAIVKVPENNPALILGYLETGVQGIIGPHIDTAATAKDLVAAVKYAPLGKRGVGFGTRAAKYGLTQKPNEYFRQANEETMVIALVESMEGIRNLDEILAVEGIDVVSLGLADLLLELGHFGNPDHPDVRSLVDGAYKKIAASGKAIAAAVRDCDAVRAREAIAKGVRLVCLIEINMLEMVSRRFFAEVKG